MSEAVVGEYAMQFGDNKVSVLYDNLETHLILHSLAGQLLISLVHRRICLPLMPPQRKKRLICYT